VRDPDASAPPRTREARHRTSGRLASLRLSGELIAYEIKTNAAGSVLGIGWAIIQPLLFVGSYWFLLTILHARHPGSGDTHLKLVTLLAGLVPWLFFARSLMAGLRSLPSHANLVKQINFPTGPLPFVAVGVPGVDFVVGIALLLVASAVAGVPAATLPLLVPVSVLLVISLLGLSSLLAPLAVMLPDVRRGAQVGLRVGLFITPVLFLPSSLPHGMEAVAYLNPMAYFISLVRYAVTGSDDVFVLGLGDDFTVAIGFTVAVALLASLVHRPTWRAVVDHL
jgi:ABC-type polysaccharide/polyol phosphate export permease